MEQTVILSIESSCDETAAAVTVNGRQVLSNVIYSQIDLHTIYGGVVPEIASRKHIEKINQVIRKALSDAGQTLDTIDAVAVTYGPGLVGALLVGVAEAKAIAYAKHLPLIGVHHIKGHVCANYIEYPELEPPFLCLVASGGHTHLVRVDDHTHYTVIGRTRDDAAGEAYDKIARAIGLGYPGGPKVEKAAHDGDPHAFEFPRAKIDENPYDFSFSGVKSAVLNTINSYKMKGMEIDDKFRNDVAASFQQSVIDSMCERVVMAMDEFQMDKFAMAGGVASNQTLRATLKEVVESKGGTFYCPKPIL
ncbi:MAG: tRNA (adenosine(37)-N6)-threonylcarbamoyltransferase complex transferase subunit TsaD, partial [Lachnospiraceae bacterium]|nr:tRNA (adenosine(37)-N6)-threonylcarbamoyltransferase complex transferase subunit TsaD [Lachnospiraceae bacterium]